VSSYFRRSGDRAVGSLGD